MAKLAFLFLTISSIYHEAHWLDFFKNQTDYSVYVHSKESLVETDSAFKEYEIAEKHLPKQWPQSFFDFDAIADVPEFEVHKSSTVPPIKDTIE